MRVLRGRESMAGLARAGAVSILLVAVLAAGCAKRPGPPPIVTGEPCMGCGMEIQDLRFACEREVDGDWRLYDAIECLVHDVREKPGGRIWLADYDTQTLHAAESLWVVSGDFPSPMGGGLAGFLDRAAADAVAVKTNGRVGRFSEMLQ